MLSDSDRPDRRLHPTRSGLVMKSKFLVATLAMGLGVAGLPAAGGLGASKAYADGYRTSGHTKRHAWGTRGTSVRGYMRRGGYYSYADEDAIDTFAWASSLF